jgi:hypothetical protein
MWERYQRTFWPTQILILAIVAFIYVSSGRLLLPAACFFVMMQGFSLIGAAWATRLKRLMEQKNGTRLPLEARA